MSQPTEKRLVVRPLRKSDIKAVQALQRRCFPDIEPWTAAQMESQLAIFPEGQLCIELDGKLVATSSSLIVDEEDHIVDLELEPGGRFELLLDGPRESCRVAAYSSGVLIQDFTLRAGRPAIVAAPVGSVSFEAYAHEGGQRSVLTRVDETSVAGRSVSVALRVGL